MKLLVGLGNPGRQYKDTRHNLGFLALDAIAKRHEIKWKKKREFHAEMTEVDLGHYRYILLKPATFMNLSGEAVRAAASFFDVKAEDIIVIHDDVDLPFGEIRKKTDGSSAGHKGVQSIIDLLKTNTFRRVRVGIGRPTEPQFPIDEWVLSKWTKQEKAALPEIIDQAIKAASEI